MAITMKVIGYYSEEAPKARQGCAHIFHSDGGVHPVVFFRETKEEAVAAATVWLETELAKRDKRSNPEVTDEMAQKIAAMDPSIKIDGRTKEGRAMKALLVKQAQSEN